MTTTPATRELSPARLALGRLAGAQRGAMSWPSFLHFVADDLRVAIQAVGLNGIVEALGWDAAQLQRWVTREEIVLPRRRATEREPDRPREVGAGASARPAPAPAQPAPSPSPVPSPAPPAARGGRVAKPRGRRGGESPKRNDWDSPRLQDCLRELVETDARAADIAAKYGVTVRGMVSIASVRGLRRLRPPRGGRPAAAHKPPRGPGRRVLTEVERKAIARLYRETAQTSAQIAAQFGLTAGGVKAIVATQKVRRMHPDRAKFFWSDASSQVLRERWDGTEEGLARAVADTGASRASVQARAAREGLTPVPRVRASHHWQATDDETLRREWGDGQDSVMAIAAVLGVTMAAVRSRAGALGLVRQKVTYAKHRWTPEERELLRREWRYQPGEAARLASLLSVKVSQVRREVGVLGLHTPRGYAPRHVWTEDDLDLMRREYVPTGAIVEGLAARMGLTPAQVKAQAHAMGLAKRTDYGQSRRREWSDEENGQLRDLLRRFSVATAAKQLGRSETSVRERAKRLGISLRGHEGWYTKREVCETVGQDHPWVQRRIDNGELVAGWQHGRRPQKNGAAAWRIEERDLGRYIVRHADEIGRNCDLVEVVRLAAKYGYGMEG